MAPPPSASVQRVPHAGIWLDGFSLTPVPGGALLAGGGEWHRDGIGAVHQAATVAALWDSAKQGWIELPPLSQPRQGHAAVALPDGRALLIGGRDAMSPERLRWLAVAPAICSPRWGLGRSSWSVVPGPL